MAPEPPKKKVLQVLYSGLGGHGSVFTSFIEGDKSGQYRHQALFYGIEPLKPEYRAFCEQEKVPFAAIQKPEGAELKSVWQVYQALCRLKPDVLVLHSMNLLLVCRLYCLRHRCQLIPVEHTPNVAKRKSEWLWTYLSFFLCRRLVYLSEEYVQQLRQKAGRWFPEQKAVVIPNGVNTQKFRCSGSQPDFSGAVVFAMQARFTPAKDHSTLLHGFAQFLKKRADRHLFKLQLAGDGQTLPDMKKLATQLGISDAVEFCGMLQEPELIRFLCRSTVYLHCSHAETLCTAVLQAMACGLPVIASDIPGINQLVEEGHSGYLLDPESPAHLAVTLDVLCGPGFENDIIRMGRRGRALAEAKYSHLEMFARYERLWA